ncbi:hypothetical protein QBC38DRAFT_456752 [Podospora fimiseda]|uniref:Ankyrin repeat protein n=1 Tax=Podospora fimiseda TaxID=252190 RepID=A0AAN7BLT6_9PEZI|nr:hypothetical protein QBC38DRAFT_456752 [Podospora fimiseda]
MNEKLGDALTDLLVEDSKSADMEDLSTIRWILGDLILVNENTMAIARTIFQKPFGAYTILNRSSFHEGCRVVDNEELLQQVLADTHSKGDITKEDDLGFTPLHLAMRWGNITACKVLLQTVPDYSLTTTSVNGESVADAALQSLSIQTLEWFSSQTSNLVAELDLLRIAAMKLDIDAMRLILSVCPEPLDLYLRESSCSQWRSALAFGFDIILGNSPLGPAENIFTTTLFLAMNTVQFLINSSDLSTTTDTGGTGEQIRSPEALRTEFRQVFDLLFLHLSTNNDLSGKTSIGLKAIEVFLTHHSCDSDMVQRMARAGFKLPWNALMHV